MSSWLADNEYENHSESSTIGEANSESSTIGEANVGDVIIFGHYEQDNDTTNGKEPITWRILDKNSSGHYLIISEKVLDVKPYNTTSISITWERSTIRSWLNGYGTSYNTVGKNYTGENFIDTAFNAEEKGKIVASDVPAHVNPDAGNHTTDKVFLLSAVEAENYFTNNEDRKADTTRYAVKQGVEGSDISISLRTCTNDQYYAYWWLRSPGYYIRSNAANVDPLGSVNNYGRNVSHGYDGVRPALWVK